MNSSSDSGLKDARSSFISFEILSASHATSQNNLTITLPEKLSCFAHFA